MIPLIIHLLNRSRHRKVRWGAMHLLSRVVRTNQRRLRIQQLILLALRCAFPAVLALALAGPVLTALDFLPGDAPGRTVILVDNSYSLAAADPKNSEDAAFQALDRAVTEILETQPEGTEIALVSIGSRPTLIQPPTLETVVKFEDRWRMSIRMPTQSRFQLRFSLRRTSSPNPIVRARRSSWSAIFKAPIGKCRRRSSSRTHRSPFIEWGESHSGNVAVESLQLPPIALTVGQNIEIKATIRNFGPAIEQAPVFLRVNGDRVAASQINLPEDGRLPRSVFSGILTSADRTWCRSKLM